MFMKPKERSEAYLAAVKALRTLIESEGLNNAGRAYAEASNDAIKDSFIKREGVTPAGGRTCVRRLLGKKCTLGHPSEIRGEASHSCLPPGSDHCSLWNKGGKASVLVSQPYSLSHTTLKEILHFCEVNGLRVDIDIMPTWHFPGAVIGVVYRKA